MPKPAAVRSKHKAPSFSSRPDLQSRGVTSGDFIKEVWHRSMPVHAKAQRLPSFGQKKAHTVWSNVTNAVALHALLL